MNSDESLNEEAAGGYFELTEDGLVQLKKDIKIALAKYRENRQKSFDQMMQRKGFFSPNKEFGNHFARYLKINRIVEKETEEVPMDDLAFYQMVAPYFEALEELVAEQREYLDLQEKFPGNKKPDMFTLVDNVVKGDYTMEDLVNLNLTDENQKSPLQLFDHVVHDLKEKTLKTVNPNDQSNNFFGDINKMDTETYPDFIEDTIFNASLGIELAIGNELETNEVREACESYLKAMAMSEVEQKIRRTEISDGAKLEEMAEAAAVSAAAFDREPATLNKTKRHLDFDIYDTSFDISFLPSDDPDVYKPLEIISYIGLTKNHHQTNGA